MKLLLLALLLTLAAWPAAAASCDAAAAHAVLADALTMKATAPTLDSFEGATYDQSQDRCSKAAQELFMNGKDGGQHLICVSHPTVPGGVEARPSFGPPGLIKSITTDLKALKPDAAQAVCDRINACLFDMSAQPGNPLTARLSGAWDQLSCEGE